MRKALAMVIALVIITTSAIFLAGCNANFEGVVFGTYYSIEHRGNISANEYKAIRNYLPSLEKEVSASFESSPVYKLNSSVAGAEVTLSRDVIELYELSLKMYEETDGVFNPATFPITELWRFSPDTFIGAADSIPTEKEIADMLPLCDPSLFALDKSSDLITKSKSEAKLDFGGIAKGYAADKAYEMLVSYGASNIVVDIGHTFKVSDSIKLYVANPRGTGTVAVFDTGDDIAIATSGDYQRCYIVNGIRYHHIIDKTGHPSGIGNPNAPISVTVVGPSAAICDALSTAVMVLDYDKSAAVLNKLGYSALILTENGYYTIGETSFEILDQRQKLN